MDFKERVYSVLIVSSVEVFSSVFLSFLPEFRYNPAKVVKSTIAAKRELLDRDYDFIFINAPLEDSFGSEFAIDCTKDSNSCVLMFVPNDLYEQNFSRLAQFGVFTLEKNNSQEMISKTLDFMIATRERLRLSQQKITSVEEKMEEIRLVNRAKWLLIDKKQMAESEAHRYIEKQAMNRSITKNQMAKNIINVLGD